ncbi:beta-ketoacyl-ACP synthase III [Micromonospora sp. NPDC023814]|uniref:beta-ketoacyl-ACP synthase III n=1 Tax=Micromonospora sp. NPDC023814 TaxID=3154596 RepID=UPI0033CF3E8A
MSVEAGFNPAESRAAVVCGAGAAVPLHVETNDDLARRMDTSDEWIRRRTGIGQRHIIKPGEATSDLAVEAGRLAMESAGLNEVGSVVVATTTPDRVCPSTAPEVASRLGLTGVAAFDVNAVCSGFLYGLATGAGLIAAGVSGSVLMIGADTFSTIVDPLDRSTAPIFGDGAGAFVLRRGRSSEPGALGPFDLGSDGHNSDLAAVPAGGSRQKAAEKAGDHFLAMAGKDMYRHAVDRMTSSALLALRRAGWTPADVDRVVPHQANIRIIKAVAKHLAVPMDRVIVNIDRLGNTAAASIPIAIVDAMAKGTIQPGHRVLVTGFGGGLTWGSTTLVWPQISLPNSYGR